jgi:hypothetical protein
MSDKVQTVLHPEFRKGHITLHVNRAPQLPESERMWNMSRESSGGRTQAVPATQNGLSVCILRVWEPKRNATNLITPGPLETIRRMLQERVTAIDFLSKFDSDWFSSRTNPFDNSHQIYKASHAFQNSHSLQGVQEIIRITTCDFSSQTFSPGPEFPWWRGWAIHLSKPLSLCLSRSDVIFQKKTITGL